MRNNGAREVCKPRFRFWFSVEIVQRVGFQFAGHFDASLQQQCLPTRLFPPCGNRMNHYRNWGTRDALTFVYTHPIATMVAIKGFRLPGLSLRRVLPLFFLQIAK